MSWGYVIFGKNQGCGYIYPNDTDIFLLAGCKRIPISVNSETLTPGEVTTLSGFFDRPLKYLGNAGGKEMIFEIGTAMDGLVKKHFYQAIYRIDERRIFILYKIKPTAGRDYIFKEGKWK